MVYIKENFKSNNKYKAQTCTYNGISYHSRAEAEYAMGLDDDLKAGRIKGWKGQHKIPINICFLKDKFGEQPTLTDKDGLKLKEKNIPFNHICNYYIDFVVDELDGCQTYVEVKGVETEAWKLKWKLCEAIFKDHPTINLKLIKVNTDWRTHFKIKNK